MTKIIAAMRLKKRLRLKVKNFMLKMRAEDTEIVQIGAEEFNWISLRDFWGKKDDIKRIFSKELKEAIEKIYNLQNQLFNIFHNDSIISNSLDAHFIMTKLNQIEEILISTRVDLAKQVYKLDSPSNNESNDESFNPFIEIGDNNEEVKFVSALVDNSKISTIISEISTKLTESFEDIAESLSTWLTSLPEPELLSISTKQSNLKHKLRWEKMMSSNSRMRHLKSYLQKARGKKI